MAIPRNCFVPLIEAVLTGVKRATYFISPKEVVKATFHGKRTRCPQRHVVITVGAPNYEERQFIKKVKKEGMKFPIRRNYQP